MELLVMHYSGSVYRRCDFRVVVYVADFGGISLVTRDFALNLAVLNFIILFYIIPTAGFNIDYVLL